MTPSPFVTIHACLRFAQRVLQLDVSDEEELIAQPPLLARCRRALDRIARGGTRYGDHACGCIVAGVRALVVRGGVVVTCVTAGAREGFTSASLRRLAGGG